MESNLNPKETVLGREASSKEIRIPIPGGYEGELILKPVQQRREPIHGQALGVREIQPPPPSVEEQLFAVVAEYRRTIMLLPIADLQTIDQNGVDNPTQEIDRINLEEATRPLVRKILEQMPDRQIFTSINHALALSLGVGPQIDEMVKLASRSYIQLMNDLIRDEISENYSQT